MPRSLAFLPAPTYTLPTSCVQGRPASLPKITHRTRHHARKRGGRARADRHEDRHRSFGGPRDYCRINRESTGSTCWRPPFSKTLHTHQDCSQSERQQALLTALIQMCRSALTSPAKVVDITGRNDHRRPRTNAARSSVRPMPVLLVSLPTSLPHSHNYLARNCLRYIGPPCNPTNPTPILQHKCVF